jgi:hypothetical protein
MNLIVPGEKYAVVVIPETLVDQNLPTHGKLADDLWFSRQPPFDLSPTLVEWIGTVRANMLKKASLFLLSKGPSSKPDILDAENEYYRRRVGSLYWSIILSGFIYCFNSPYSIIGAARAGNLEIARSIGEFPQPHVVSCMVQERIDLQRLQRASQYAATIPDFEGLNRFDRFGRIMRAFYYGIISHHPPDSLHQFVRCVEGFIYPDTGSSTRQFKSRTELFLGHGFHDLAGELYDIRSALEHLHDPFSVIKAGTERERRVILFVRSVQAEALARYCIQRLLDKPTLRTHFETDTAIKGFWKMSQDEKRKLWGDPLNITATNKMIRSDQIRDEDIGLNKNTPSP